MKTVFGSCNNNAEPSLNVKQAVKDLKAPTLILFFSDDENFAEYARILNEMFPDCTCMGCSAHRTFGSGATGKYGLSLVAFEDGITCCADYVEKVDNFVIGQSEKVSACFDSIGTAENTLCVEFTVPYKQTEEYVLMLLNSILLRKNVPIIGGTAAHITSTDPNAPEIGYVALNGKVLRDGCVFAMIHNCGGGIKLYKENIYEPFSEREFTVTKATGINRTIMTLGGISAIKVYAQELGVDEADIDKHFFYHPLGRRAGSDTYVTAISGWGSHGALRCLARVHEGTKMMVMKEGDYKAIAKQTIQTVKNDIESPSLVLMFNCAARTMLFEVEGYLEEYNKLWSDSFGNFIGFSCVGEQLGTKHFNHTMMLAVFE